VKPGLKVCSFTFDLYRYVEDDDDDEVIFPDRFKAADGVDAGEGEDDDSENVDPEEDRRAEELRWGLHKCNCCTVTAVDFNRLTLIDPERLKAPPGLGVTQPLSLKRATSISWFQCAIA
jgi:hypothetical protein